MYLIMNKLRISIIVAMAENRVIGNKGEIPWNIPGEQKRVKEITTPHPLIMGRKTHEAIGRVLPGRLNIVVTSDQKYEVEGGVVAHSLDEALGIAKKVEQERIIVIPAKAGIQILDRVEDDVELEIFIFGGGKLYEQAIPLVDRLYLTIVHKNVEGDAYFPEYSEFIKEISREEKEYEGLKYTYLTLER